MQGTVGIDISKDPFDMHRLSVRRHARFGNGKAGLRALLHWIGKAPVPVVAVPVVYKATGRYHRDPEAVPGGALHALVKVTPTRARRFARHLPFAASWRIRRLRQHCIFVDPRPFSPVRVQRVAP